MISDITYAVSEMTSAVHAFNQKWPALVTNGCVWKIPLLDEPRAKSVIEPEVLLGQAAIDEAIKAIAAFYREPNQFPGTVMRLPGWFALRESVVPDLLHIQDLKQRIVDVIESTRLELNAPPYMRSNLLRSATSNNISQKQLIRCPQAFDGQPRLLVFTWAGHTSGTERIPVNLVRQQLQSKAQLQADKNGVAIDQTPAAIEAVAIANLPDSVHLARYKKVAPHPRLMLYFSDSTRYDAMIHANLPVFFMDSDPEVRGLDSFNLAARSSQRPDTGSRQLVVPSMGLYLSGKDVSGKSAAGAGQVVALRVPLEIDSTYNRNE